MYLGFELLRSDWFATTPLSLHRPALAHDGSPVPERYRYIAHDLVAYPLYPGFWKIFGDYALLMLGESVAVPGQIGVFADYSSRPSRRPGLHESVHSVAFPPGTVVFPFDQFFVLWVVLVIPVLSGLNTLL